MGRSVVIDSDERDNAWNISVDRRISSAVLRSDSVTRRLVVSLARKI